MSTKCKSILILSYYAYPSTAVGAKRVSELIKALEKYGHKTVTISAKGPDLLDDDSLRDAMVGTELIRVASPQKVYPVLKNLIGRRLENGARDPQTAHLQESIANNRSVGVRATVKRWLLSLEAIGNTRKFWCMKVITRLLLLRLSTRFDLILASGPPQIAYFCGAFASSLYNSPLVLDFRDPWPTSREQNPVITSKLSRRIDDWLMRYTFSKTTVSVFTAIGAKNAMTSEHPKLASAAHVVYNGFDGLVNENNSRLGQGSLTLMFAGTLYFNRDPFPFFTAIKSLIESQTINPRLFRFKLLGHCERAMGTDIQPWLESNGLTETIELMPPVSPAVARTHLQTADILVNFAQGQPNQIPAKLFEYIGSNKFVLQISERASDSATVLTNSRAGRVIEPDDQMMMHETLEELYQHYVSGTRSDLISESTNIEQYSRKLQNDIYVKLLNTVAQSPLN